MGALNNKYNASVQLQVVVPIGYDYDVKMLERQIRLVDTAFPWVVHYSDGQQAPSISWMSSITMKEGDGIDRHYNVEIRPHFLQSREQCYAYERYGDQLAEELARIMTKDVIRVASAIMVHGCFNNSYRPRDL